MSNIPYEGDIVRLHGREFVAKDVLIITMVDGRKVYRFKGICTEHPINDEIRGTEYDGSFYGDLVRD